MSDLDDFKATYFDECSELLLDLEERIGERVAALLAEYPEVRVKDPALAAAVVVQTVEALTHKLVVHGTQEQDLEAYVEEIVRLVVRYLAAGR